MLLLAAALAVQSAYVNPSVALAEVRALACCAHNCDDEPLSLPSVRGCCQVTAVASGPAEQPGTAGIGVAATSVLVSPLALPVVRARSSAVVLAVPASGTGPPAYLAHQHLLI